MSEKVTQFEVTLPKLITECACKSECSLSSVFFYMEFFKWKCPIWRNMPLRLNYDLNNLPLGTAPGDNKTRSKNKSERL